MSLYAILRVLLRPHLEYLIILNGFTGEDLRFVGGDLDGTCISNDIFVLHSSFIIVFNEHGLYLLRLSLSYHVAYLILHELLETGTGVLEYDEGQSRQYDDPGTLNSPVAASMRVPEHLWVQSFASL